MSEKENLSIIDLQQLSDELRFIANNVYGVCEAWENNGTPAKHQQISMFGFFTSNQLQAVADKLEQIGRNVSC